METQRAVGNESTDHDRVEQLLSNVPDENPLKAVVTDLLEENRELRDRIERVELSRDAAHKRIDELAEQVSASESGGSTGEDGSPEETSTEKSALERICDDDEANPAGVQITSSVDRAAEIMNHWAEWSSKAPKGRTVRSGLKRLIETATGETLAWNQVYRACRKVEQLTKGKIVFTETRKHGKILLQPDRPRPS